MLDHPAGAKLAVGTSSALAAMTWYDAVDWTVRVIAGLVAIGAGLYSIYSNSKRK